MLTAGWQAHKLNAPGKFLISAPEHDVPRRARAHLLTDQAVSDTAARHAGSRPELDEVSVRALDERASTRPQTTPDERHTDHGEGAETEPEARAEDAEKGPQALLWAALRLAPAEGIPVADLVTATGMSQRWVHYHLRALANAGRATQIRRGIWRATGPEGDAP